MQGMADMGKEMSKIKGVAVLTVMRMGSTVSCSPLTAASRWIRPWQKEGRRHAASSGRSQCCRRSGRYDGVHQATCQHLFRFRRPFRFEVPVGGKQINEKDLH